MASFRSYAIEGQRDGSCCGSVLRREQALHTASLLVGVEDGSGTCDGLEKVADSCDNLIL